jgi:hypothetical protein
MTSKRCIMLKRTFKHNTKDGVSRRNVMLPLCSFNLVCNVLGADVNCHTRAISSSLAVNTCLPLGDISTDQIVPRCPDNVSNKRPLSNTQTHAVASADPVTETMRGGHIKCVCHVSMYVGHASHVCWSRGVLTYRLSISGYTNIMNRTGMA